AIADIAARFPPFTFQLARVGRFPGVLYLAPEPAHPFVTLIEAVLRRWPQHPPYGGRYATVVPHVTVFDGPEPPGLVAALQDALPLDCKAEELHLFVQDRPGRWQLKHQVALRAPGPSQPIAKV